MISQLEAIGLTNGEARVYKALSEIGTSSVGPICDTSKVHRSIIYQILEKLLEKGIVSSISENNVKKYQAASPKVLLQFVEQEQEHLEDKKKSLVEIFPLITQLQASGKRASATLYSGFNGLLTATFNILDRLKEGEEYYMVNIPAVQPETHHTMWEKFQMIRDEKKIKGKQLYSPKVSDEILKMRTSHKGLDARRMPIDFQSPPTYYFVYKDVTVIALSQGTTPLAIEIISQEIADGFRAYCDWLWKQSKPFKSVKK
jgi:HTH-type transcriptional regulator, sugar sensing transcriptional regulator